MGVMDKVKGLLHGHEAQAKQAVDKAGDMIDAKTGGKYAEQVDKVQDQADKQIDDMGQG